MQTIGVLTGDVVLFRRAWLVATAMLVVALAGCSGPATLEPRPGYIADRQYTAPSHSSRVRHLVLHYTDSDQADSLATLTGPHVSSHYLVPLPTRWARGVPRVYQLVDESQRAWHAGASRWGNRPHINDTSIGIEIVNAGPTRPFAQVERRLEENPQAGITWMPYPDEQIEALIHVARDIIERHGIHPTRVVGHADIAPSRKIDPGPAFPWQRLYEEGIGAWPDESKVAHYLAQFAQTPPSLGQLQAALGAYGYPIVASGKLDEQTRNALRAFQMHFRPGDYRGLPDPETAAIVWALLERYRPEALHRLNTVQPASSAR